MQVKVQLAFCKGHGAKALSIHMHHVYRWPLRLAKILKQTQLFCRNLATLYSINKIFNLIQGKHFQEIIYLVLLVALEAMKGLYRNQRDERGLEESFFRSAATLHTDMSFCSFVCEVTAVVGVHYNNKDNITWCYRWYHSGWPASTIKLDWKLPSYFILSYNTKDTPACLLTNKTNLALTSTFWATWKSC